MEWKTVLLEVEVADPSLREIIFNELRKFARSLSR
jgi:hypothetical protein